MKLIFLFLIFHFIFNKLPEKNNYTSFFLNSSIQTLNNSNFDKIINKGLNDTFIVLFTVKRCKICNNVLLILEAIKKEYENKIKFAKVDFIESGWTAFRFYMDKVPKIILIKNNSYTSFNKNFSYENLIDFIENNNNNKFYKFPSKLSYLDILYKFFNAVDDEIKQKMNNYNIKWEKSLTIIIFILIVIILIIIQQMFLKCSRKIKNKFFGKKDNKNNKIKNDHNPKHNHYHNN
jgi:thioredoxin 1